MMQDEPPLLKCGNVRATTVVPLNTARVDAQTQSPHVDTVTKAIADVASCRLTCILASKPRPNRICDARASAVAALQRGVGMSTQRKEASQEGRKGNGWRLHVNAR